MCVVMAEWSKAQVSRPRGASDPRSPDENLFWFSFIIRSVQHVDKAVVTCLFIKAKEIADHFRCLPRVNWAPP